jgi:N-acetylmuramoyl-L-alanine amidase
MANWRNLLLVAAAPALLYTARAEAATLNQWTFNDSTNRLEFTTDSAVQPKAFLLFKPYRIVIDLPNTKLGSASVRKTYPGDVKQGAFGD